MATEIEKRLGQHVLFKLTIDEEVKLGLDAPNLLDRSVGAELGDDAFP